MPVIARRSLNNHEGDIRKVVVSLHLDSHTVHFISFHLIYLYRIVEKNIVLIKLRSVKGWVTVCTRK